MRKKLLLPLFLLLGILFTGCDKELIFTITDMKFASVVDKEYQLREKEDFLGAKIRLELYDNAAKLYWEERNGEKSRAYVYEKVKEDEYIGWKGDNPITLKLERNFGKISALTVSALEPKTTEYNVIYAKRD